MHPKFQCWAMTISDSPWLGSLSRIMFSWNMDYKFTQVFMNSIDEVGKLFGKILLNQVVKLLQLWRRLVMTHFKNADNWCQDTPGLSSLMTIFSQHELASLGMSRNQTSVETRLSSNNHGSGNNGLIQYGHQSKCVVIDIDDNSDINIVRFRDGIPVLHLTKSPT